MTIRSFVSKLHALSPLDKLALMTKYDMSEKEADESLKNSWLIQTKSNAPSDVLDNLNPTPDDLIECCHFNFLNIGNISLTSDVVTLGHHMEMIGHIHQNVLLYNKLNGVIYICDYEMDITNVQKVAVNFSSFLDAFLCYCEYYRWFYIDPEITMESELDKEKMAIDSVVLTGVLSDDNIFLSIF